MEIQHLKERIEKLTKHHQIEILRILSNKKAAINENNNGSFINLTELDDNIIHSLYEYIKYVDEQEKSLKEIELEKECLENKFFKDNKELNNVYI
tara:strand:+ start:1109 stop:1393 length:285 start_codon:yes stop_codon:yes gene_type:complete